MVASDQESTREFRRESGRDESEVLPFTVEITDRAAGERTLARAATASLALAIFSAACKEYPQAHVRLKRGTEIIVDSESA